MVSLIYMRLQRKFLPFLYLFLMSLLPLGFYLLLVSPDQKFEIFNTVIQPVIFLLTMVFISFFLLFSFLFVNTRRGILASIFVVGLLILRFFEIRTALHALLLLAIILLIEFLFLRRPPSIQGKKSI